MSFPSHIGDLDRLPPPHTAFFGFGWNLLRPNLPFSNETVPAERGAPVTLHAGTRSMPHVLDLIIRIDISLVKPN
jgi:hypothetical protein